MKTFENTLNKKFTFSSCDTCDARCCDGKRGSTFAQITLEDFEMISNNFPIAFLLGNLGYLKPVVLLSNGKSYCRYIKDNRCTIYNQRPSVCRVYPLSPHLTNDIYIDTLCPAVNKMGKTIVENNTVFKDFKNDVLVNYQDKYINMHNHFTKFNKKENLDVLIQIRGDVFYKFKEDFNDKFIELHISSLKKFDSYFI